MNRPTNASNVTKCKFALLLPTRTVYGKLAGQYRAMMGKSTSVSRNVTDEMIGFQYYTDYDYSNVCPLAINYSEKD